MSFRSVELLFTGFAFFVEMLGNRAQSDEKGAALSGRVRPEAMGPAEPLSNSMARYAEKNIVAYLSRLRQVKGLEDLSYAARMVEREWTPALAGTAPEGTLDLYSLTLVCGVNIPTVPVSDPEVAQKEQADGLYGNAILKFRGYVGENNPGDYEVSVELDAKVGQTGGRGPRQVIAGLEPALEAMAKLALERVAKVEPHRPMGAGDGIRLADSLSRRVF